MYVPAYIEAGLLRARQVCQFYTPELGVELSLSYLHELPDSKQIYMCWLSLYLAPIRVYDFDYSPTQIHGIVSSTRSYLRHQLINDK